MIVLLSGCDVMVMCLHLCLVRPVLLITTVVVRYREQTSFLCNAVVNAFNERLD